MNIKGSQLPQNGENATQQESSDLCNGVALQKQVSLSPRSDCDGSPEIPNPAELDEICPSSSTEVEDHDAGWFRKKMRKISSTWSTFRLPEQSSSKDSKWRRRISATWDNVKYSEKWMSLSESDYSSKGYIVFLGKFYAAEGSDTVVGLNFVDFCRDYYTRLWITYRTGMPPLLDSEVTSDCGWGCMIRTTQMAFAQAIVTNRLGRGWRYFGPKPKLLRDESLPHIEGDPLYNSQIDIIKLFEDMPSAPLGIHRLLEIFVNEYDENPIGKWYTPSQVIFLFKKALRTSASPLTCDLSLMLANDGRVIVDDAERECHYWSKRLLLFIPLRLGTNVVNPIYTDHICQLLSQKTCLGLLGGRPDHSLYFIGYYDNHVIYLDPHVAQEYAPISMWEDLSSCKGITEEEKGKMRKHPLGTYHNRSYSKMAVKDMDPSCVNQVVDVDLGPGEGSKCTRDPLFTVFYNEASITDSIRETTEDEMQQALEHGFELL
ncbi:hypothetical protein Q1695_012192 [Nippostrongylus brasiliensis]|nr:hypothetical protein Q1695_012192 [Nippostrongylus brasiliensis]